MAIHKVHISYILNKLFLGQPLNRGSITYIQEVFRRCKEFSKPCNYKRKPRFTSLREKILTTKPMSFIPAWLEKCVKMCSDFLLDLLQFRSQNIPQKWFAIWLALS